jgi:hypothetical protein
VNFIILPYQFQLKWDVTIESLSGLGIELH